MFEGLKRMLGIKVPAEPQQPVPFGYNMDWLAARCSDPEAMIRELGRLEPRIAKAVPCSWSHGIERAYAGRLFVTPAIDGWVLTPGYQAGTDLDVVLAKLSAALDTRVCQFGNVRTVSYVSYGLAERGRVVRLYAHVDGETPWDVGAPTDEERALELRYWDELEEGVSAADEDAIFEALPDEATVHALAAAWSVNPNADGWSDHPPGVGWLLA